jgi:hypothetical protein
MKLYNFFLFILLLSCQKFIKKSDPDYHHEIPLNTQSEFMTLIFSHNINGELEPCGCRQFPLGGLPQIAGAIHKIKKMGPALWVDIGDTFYPNTVIPKGMHKSHQYMATSLYQALVDLNLDIFVPGDQDLANSQWLKEISQKSPFKFLMSNYFLNDYKFHKKISTIWGDRQIHFFSYLSPEIFENKLNVQSIDQLKNEIKSHSKNDLIIVLSHSGLEFDKKMAEEIPEIDWILGSHSQSFLRSPIVIGQTKIAQVLSKNHYLGTLKIPYNSKREIEYNIVEIRDELKNDLANNPFVNYIQNYRSGLQKIQEKESLSMMSTNGLQKKVPHVNSCVECHATQVKFWSTTPHSLAYLTLEKKQAEYNPECIACHSVHFKKPTGFYQHKDIVLLENGPASHLYWKKIKELSGKVKIVRDMSASNIKNISEAWLKYDQTQKVKHNFANVQCFNCHQQDMDHPFSLNENRKKNYSSQCIECHTMDQSPEWYHPQTRKLESSKFQEKLKKVQCPKGT